MIAVLAHAGHTFPLHDGEALALLTLALLAAVRLVYIARRERA